MKSMQFYSLLKEVTKKEDITHLLQLYRLSAEPGLKGVQASVKLEEWYYHAKRLKNEYYSNPIK